MVFKLFYEAAKFTGDFTVGLGKAIFTNKDIPTLPMKDMARVPRGLETTPQYFRSFPFKTLWRQWPPVRWFFYGLTTYWIGYWMIMTKAPRDKYLREISDLKSHKQHVHHFRGLYQREQDHHYWEHYHPRKAGEIDEALLKNAKHSEGWLEHGPMAIKH